MSGGGSQQSAKRDSPRGTTDAPEGRVVARTSGARREQAGKNREAGERAEWPPPQEAYENRAYPATRVAYAQSIARTGVQPDRREVEDGPDGDRVQRLEERRARTLNVSLFGTQTYGAADAVVGPRDRAGVVLPEEEEAARSTSALPAAASGSRPTRWRRSPTWKQISDSWFATTSIGTITIDPTDPTGNTIYVGTGEPNGSSDSEAGVGVYKSTDGGPRGRCSPAAVAAAKDRGIAHDRRRPGRPESPADGHGRRPPRRVLDNGGRFTPPGAPTIGLYESTTAVATWNLIFNQAQDPVDPATSNGGDFFRGGVTKIEYDPNDPGRLLLLDDGLRRSTARDRAASSRSSRTRDRLGPARLRGPLRVRGGQDRQNAECRSGRRMAKCTRIYLGAGSNGEPATSDLRGLAAVPDRRRASTRFARRPVDRTTAAGSPVVRRPGRSRLRLVRLLPERPVLVRHVRGVAARPAEHGVPRRLDALRASCRCTAGRPTSNGRAVIRSTDAGVT